MTVLISYMDFGLMISLVGYIIVLAALAFLFGVYLLIPKLLNAYTKQRLKRQGKKCAQENTLQLSGLESAAIAAAVHYILSELHDLESGEITIKKVSKKYSPWSSKIYSMNNYKR